MEKNTSKHNHRDYIQCYNKQVHMVENQQVANAMWEFPKMKYSHTKLPKWLTNLKKLTSLTLKENEDVETFFDTWKTQLDEVILFGVNLHDEVQVMLLLATFSSTWKPFIIAQSTITYQTLDQLLSKIQQGKPMRIYQESTYHPSSITMATNLYTKHHKNHLIVTIITTHLITKNHIKATKM